MTPRDTLAADLATVLPGCAVSPDGPARSLAERAAIKAATAAAQALVDHETQRAELQALLENA